METSNVIFTDDAIAGILKGVDILANAVKSTMGPSGGTVIIDRVGKPPHLTKDGVTVAKAISLEDRLQNIGASIIKEAAQRTAETAGDGTTTSTVIAQELARQIIKMTSAGFNARDIYAAIQDGVDAIVDELSTISSIVKDEKDLQNIARISANGEEVIANIVAKAFQHVGSEGSVTVEEAKGFETSIDLVDGTELDRGYLSHYFASNSNNTECKLENPNILILDGAVKTFQQIIPFVQMAHENGTPLIIIASEFDNDVIQSLVVNKMKAGLKICAIKAPEFGQARSTTLNDLATLFGCEVLLEVESSKITERDTSKFLGTAKKSIINKNKSLFVGTGGDKERIDKLVCDIVKNLEKSSLSDSELKFLKRRKIRLSSGIAVIRVGGDTSAEVTERLDRVDDAIQATKAAIAEGFVPGGGITLAKLADNKLKEKRSNSDSYNVGLRSLKEACHAPIRQILSAFSNAETLIAQTKRKTGNITINAITGEIVDAIDEGIIDPSKVVRLSIINAASAALNLLKVKCVAILEQNNIDDTELFINENM
jgi:chaperonin GroEL